MSCYVQALGIISPLGEGLEATRRGLFAGDTSGMRVESGWLPNAPACIGRVMGELAPLPAPLAEHDCRNNRLLAAAAAQIRPAIDAALARYGAQRVAIVIGTSTSGIASGEDAMAAKIRDGAFPPGFSYKQQEIGATAPFAARLLGVRGPAYTVSTACTSGAKALLAARRLLDLGLCDAAIAGGVDTLCRLTVGGFAALESTSPQRCNPLSRNRNGINIGEGAALFLLSREPATVRLRGWGESSDGHHISAPDPAGVGARLAMERGLSRAGVAVGQVEYINLHGTATVQNDAMEVRVVHALFGDRVAVSSTKPFTGHTLGAAGAIEAGLCWLAMQDDNTTGKLPPHLWDGLADPVLPALNIVEPGARLGHPLRCAVSNSFAFGGANAVLVLGRE